MKKFVYVLLIAFATLIINGCPASFAPKRVGVKKPAPQIVNSNIEVCYRNLPEVLGESVLSFSVKVPNVTGIDSVRTDATDFCYRPRYNGTMQILKTFLDNELRSTTVEPYTINTRLAKDSLYFVFEPKTVPVVSEEGYVSQLAVCENHYRFNRLTTGAGGNAADCYRAILTKDAKNEAALQGLERITERYITLAQNSVDKQQYGKAERFLKRLAIVSSEHPKIEEFSTTIEEGKAARAKAQQEEEAEMMRIAALQRDKEEETRRKEQEKYEEALKKLQQGEIKLQEAATQRAAELKRQEEELERKEEELKRKEEVLEQQREEESEAELKRKEEEFKRKQEELKRKQEALKQQRLKEEQKGKQQQQELKEKREAEKSLRLALEKKAKEKEAEEEEKAKARSTITDSFAGPQLVSIRKGCFLMGSPESEPSRDVDETLHYVCIERGFEIGKYEVSFDEYDLFVQDTKGVRPNDWSWGRGDRPAINVSWVDALAYTQWLTEKTGKRYRLPTEAEWEYTARAGSTTRFPWGDVAANQRANCDGCKGKMEGQLRTASVGSFPANKWELYDTAGNVWEWTCSVYDDSYSGAETKCITSSDEPRVIRGGSWKDGPSGIRSAYRNGNTPSEKSNDIGFRVVRY